MVVRQLAQSAGAAQVWITSGRFAFAFDEGPRRVQALLFGSCTSFGPVWFAEVQGQEPYWA